MPFAGLDRAGWIRLADGAALLATVLIGAAMIAATLLWFGVDFRAFYAAGRLVANGQDPYDYELTVPILLEISDSVGNAPFYYPPWFALLMVPFALLPYGIARVVWISCSLALWGASVWLVRDALRWHLWGWRLWLIVLSMLYMLVWVCIRSEQTGPLVFAAIALAFWAIERDRPVVTGVALALALTKPQIVALGWLALLACVLTKRQWSATLSFAVTLAILVAVSSWAMPGWYANFVQSDYGLGLGSMLDGPGNVIGKRLTSTFSDLLWYAGVLDPVAGIVWAVVALCSIGGLFLLWLDRASLAYTLAMALPLWFLITPYAMQYDYVVMTFSMMWAYKEIREATGWLKWVASGALVFMHSLLLWEGLSVEGLWLPVGMCLVLVCLGWERVTSSGERR
jgi:hypothetical protein